MGRLAGRLVDVGLGKETTRGTAVAASKWVPKQSLSYQDKAEVIVEESGLGRIESDANADLVKQWSEGSIEGVLRDDSFGLILLALFGQAPTSVQRGATGVYDHSFSVANNNSHASLSVVIKDANETWRMALAMLETLEINYALGQYITYTATFKGKRGATTTATVAYTAENRFRPQDVVAKFATNLAGLDAAQAVKVKNLRLKFTKNLEDYQALGSVDLEDVHNLAFGVEVTVELLWEDATYKDYVFNQTRRACRIAVQNTGVDLGSGHNPEVRFDFASLAFTDWTKSGSQDEIVSQTVTAKALYSIADASEVTGRLTNRTTSY